MSCSPAWLPPDPHLRRRRRQLVFLEPFNAARFSPFFRESIDAYFFAEEAYKANEIERAQQILNAFWKKHPAGTEQWAQLSNEGLQHAKSTGANFGLPPCYYALRMLTDCVRWRAENKNPGPPAATVTWSIVLVGKASGIMPRTMAELNANGGVPTNHTLHPLLTANNSEIIHQSQWFFSEYVRAATSGKLAVKVEILHLPNLEVPVHCKVIPNRFAELGEGAMDKIWTAVPENTRAHTDWWMVVYPSHVPARYKPFASTEFITGGMGTGPDGGPCFIADDLWLVRKPPHLGIGDYTNGERRAYLPQWYQHEFFHHLYRSYPAMKLEAKDHQWFDRKTWPADFVGLFEPDYYHESLHRRLMTAQAVPPLHVKLRLMPGLPSKSCETSPSPLFREPTFASRSRTVITRGRSPAGRTRKEVRSCAGPTRLAYHGF